MHGYYTVSYIYLLIDGNSDLDINRREIIQPVGE
jgi:hypothetical protein